MDMMDARPGRVSRMEIVESGRRRRFTDEAKLAIVAEIYSGLRQVTDMSSIEPILDKLIADNPGQVETVRKNPKVAGWFTGQVMKATGGKANPQLVNQLVAQKLGL